uniref:Uncharacterized protein n=1 Tax=Anguilla anguilla TaxID=7936 RepID=A0A0E9W0Z8_ANGAN
MKKINYIIVKMNKNNTHLSKQLKLN